MLLSHDPIALEREHEGERIIQSDPARGTGANHLSDCYHLVAGIDQLNWDDVVSGHGLLVFLVDQPDGLVAVVGSQQQGLEHDIRVVELNEGVEVTSGCALRIPP